MGCFQSLGNLESDPEGRRGPLALPSLKLCQRLPLHQLQHQKNRRPSSSSSP